MTVPQSVDVVTTIAVYTWPFLFSLVVGLIVWIWKERTVERAESRFKEGVTAVRRNFDTEIANVENAARDRHTQLERRVARLEQHVFGMDGEDGMRGELRALSRRVEKLTRTMTVWAAHENIEMPEDT